MADLPAWLTVISAAGITTPVRESVEMSRRVRAPTAKLTECCGGAWLARIPRAVDDLCAALAGSRSGSRRRFDPMHRKEGQDALQRRLAVGAEGAFDEMMAGAGEHVDFADLIRRDDLLVQLLGC
jgi:hypothetical protein